MSFLRFFFPLLLNLRVITFNKLLFLLGRINAATQPGRSTLFVFMKKHDSHH